MENSRHEGNNNNYSNILCSRDLQYNDFQPQGKGTEWKMTAA